MEERVAGEDELRAGETRSVKVGRMPVLLVRLDDGYHALPGRCTHRPRPLAKGTLHGSRIMCPRHQAAFDVRTGDALEPPALDGLPSLPVSVRDGGVYVTVDEDLSESRVMPMGGLDPGDGRLFAIIGAGGAGAVAAETLRRAGYGGRILMVSRERRPPYDRPCVSEDYLTGKLTATQLPLRAEGFYAEHEIELRHDTVIDLHVPTRTIVFGDGEELRPDAVLIATGGTANALPVAGGDLDGVYTLRSVDDCDLIMAAATGTDAAVVIGASFVGLEVAASLTTLGISTTVVAPESVPLAGSLGPAVGERVRRLHEARGVRFRLGRAVRELVGGPRVEGVRLTDGELLPAHFVVLGIGVRPATAFVRGVDLEPDGSVMVDDEFRVGDGGFGVWAAGDVATYPEPYTGRHLRIEHWRVAQQQGKAAALSMAGQGEPFDGVPFFWTQHYRLNIGYVGVAPQWDEIVLGGDVEADDFIAYYLDQGVVRAAAGTRESQLGAFAELMRTGCTPAAALLRDDPDVDLRGLLAEVPVAAPRAR